MAGAADHDRGMDLGLKDRVAVVAAASSGLGKAVARALAREGARVAVCARKRQTIEEAGRDVGAVYAAAVDVTNEDQVTRFLEEVAARLGPVSICVPNAGGPPAKNFAGTTVHDWRNAVELNLLSTLYLVRGVLPGMQAQKWGRIVTITSTAAKQPIDGLVLSNSVRAAVAGLVKSLANEYGPHGITVNNVCPGYTETERLNVLADMLAGNEGVARGQIHARWAQQIPLRRIGTPEEFADVVAFLASERASYVTGASLGVDGGYIRGIFS